MAIYLLGVAVGTGIVIAAYRELKGMLDGA